MSRNTRTVNASVDQVWDVLSDGWLYPLWVVGASRMREVDDSWPSPGAQLHHSVGAWPVLIDDTTEVLEVRPRSMLRLRARGWPLGEADVVIHVEAGAGGTVVTIDEDAVSGPGTLVPSFLRQPALAWRNAEALERFAYVVENRT